MKNIKMYLIERLTDLTKITEETRGYKKIENNTKQIDNKLKKQQEDRSWFRQQAEVEVVEASHCKVLARITEKDVGASLK